METRGGAKDHRLGIGGCGGWRLTAAQRGGSAHQFLDTLVASPQIPALLRLGQRLFIDGRRLGCGFAGGFGRRFLGRDRFGRFSGGFLGRRSNSGGSGFGCFGGFGGFGSLGRGG